MDTERAEFMEKMFLEVQDMLKVVYSPKEVPHFEVNKTTVQILYRILKKMEIEQKMNKELAKCYTWMASSHAVKSKAIKESLESMHLSLDDLHEDCQKAVNALATVACSLSMKEPTIPNFLLAFNHLDRESFEVSEQKRKFLQQQSKLTKKFQLVLEKIDALQKDVSSSKKKKDDKSAEVTKRTTQTSFLQVKKQEYKRKEKELEEKLKESGYDSSIHHSELVKKNEEIQRLEERLNSISAKLNSYHSLPPNENLARLKVEEARQELFNLQQEIQRNIEF